jgi:death-on-curing protein
MQVIWVEEPVVLALHEEHLAEHGGVIGIRDRGLLESALIRPQNLALYSTPDLADLAAAYGFGLVRNHPFIDGNKRTAFVLTEIYLCLKVQTFISYDSSCVAIMLKLAEGGLSEKAFADWLRQISNPP